jgi:hypothetical protein
VKVLVCGSRDWPPLSGTGTIRERIEQLPEGALVIAGGAKGADTMAAGWAVRRGLFVAEVCCARDHWELFGKRAGHRRNAAMLDLAPDFVIAFQRNGSSGTQNTIDEARRRGIPVEVITP